MINKDSDKKHKSPDDDVKVVSEEHIMIKDKDTGKILINKRG